jgi:hypothetical protein
MARRGITSRTVGAAMGLLVASVATSAVVAPDGAAGARATDQAATCTADVRFVAGSSPAPRGDASLLAGVRSFAGGSACVTTVADDAASSSALADADVVVVSSSVHPATVGDRLADLGVPALVSEPHLFDDLGAASAAGGREISAHPGTLTAIGGRLTGSTTGPLDVLTGSGTLNVISPSAVSDPVVGARVAGTTDLAVWGTTIEDMPHRVGFFAGYGATLSPAGTKLLHASLAWLTSGRPRNDDAIDARNLGTAVGFWNTATVRGATVEPGELSPTGTGTVWYRWTAPTTGNLEVLIADGRLRIGTGAGAASFHPIGEVSAERGFVAMRQGLTYRIQVAGTGAGSVPFSLRTVLRRPANDAFGAATVLSGASGLVTGWTIGATTQPGEPAGGGGAPDSVWYRWTAPVSGPVMVATDLPHFDGDGQPYDAVVGVFRGGTLTTLTRLGGPDEQVVFDAQAGRTYRFAVDGTGPGSRFQLTWGDPVTRPTNDDFADAMPIAGASGSVDTITKGARFEAGEPTAPFSTEGTVWFRWTAPADGVLVLGSGSVWTGDRVDALTPVLSLRDGAVVRAGTDYRIQVLTLGEGRQTISWSMLPPVPNDDLADAVAIGGPTGSVTGDNRGATVEAGEGPGTTFCVGENNVWEPDHARTVWYRWTAPAPGVVVFDLVPDPATSADQPDCLELLGGTDVSDLTGISEGRHAPVVAGQSVLVRVGSTCWGQWYCEGSAGNPFTVSWRYVDSPPANDAFAAATPLTGTGGTVEVVTIGATTEPGEPGDAGCSTRSVWWTFTAPADGTFDRIRSGRAQECGGLFVGDALSELIAVPAVGFARHQVEAGTRYRIQLAVGGDPFPGTWAFFETPANDALADAVEITGTSGSVEAHAVGATLEPGEPDPSGGEGSAWWRWVAPQDGVLRTNVDVYEGSTPATLVPVAGAWSWSSVTYRVTAGTTYHLAAYERSGRFTLTWTMDRPANDDLADAMPLVGSAGTVTVDDTGATSEPGEPHGNETLWWSWTAPDAAPLRLEIGRPAGGLPWLHVFTGTGLDDLTEVVQTNAAAAFVPEAGTTYLLRSINNHTNGDTTGPVELRWEPAVANDPVAAALPIAGPTGTIGADTTRATTDTADPRTFGWPRLTHTVWYRWIAPTTGQIVFDTAGTTFDTLLAVYEGAPTWNTEAAASNDDAYPTLTSRLTLDAVAGTEYWVMVGGFLGATGPVTLHWRTA